MSKIKTALLQTEIFWEDISANLASYEEKIWAIEEKVDLIILPEMFTTGFSMNAQKLAEPENHFTYKWMKQIAEQTSSTLMGSYIVKSEGKFFNRLCVVSPDGSSKYYNKRHLFRMGEEDQTFSAGSENVIININNFKIRPLICYDLRFPVWSRNKIDENTGDPEYDILIYVANWPAPRTEVWDALLKARALENQCFCVGVNRVGIDGSDINYKGHSAIYDFKGKELNELSEENDVKIVELNLQQLVDFRKKFPTYLDADQFSIE